MDAQEQSLHTARFGTLGASDIGTGVDGGKIAATTTMIRTLALRSRCRRRLRRRSPRRVRRRLLRLATIYRSPQMVRPSPWDAVERFGRMETLRTAIAQGSRGTRNVAGGMASAFRITNGTKTT